MLGILGCVLRQVPSPIAWVKGNSAKREMDAQPAIVWTNPRQRDRRPVLGVVGTCMILLSIVLVVAFIAGATASSSWPSWRGRATRRGKVRSGATTAHRGGVRRRTRCDGPEEVLAASKLVLIPVANLGALYTVTAGVLGAIFIAATLWLRRRPTPATRCGGVRLLDHLRHPALLGDDPRRPHLTQRPGRVPVFDAVMVASVTRPRRRERRKR